MAAVHSRDGSIEDELEKLRQEAVAYPHVAQQLVGLRYFIASVISRVSEDWRKKTSGVTNFVALVDELERWRHNRSEQVLRVTFNYDDLLEHALENVVLGYNLKSFDDFVSDSRYQLIKVHGSYYWSRRVLYSTSARETSSMTLTDEFLWRQMSSEMIPAIAVPTVHKSGFECPPAHVDALRRQLPEVDRLLVVGWRGRDRHFLPLLKLIRNAELKGIHIVDGSDEGAASVALELSKFGGVRSDNTLLEGLGFSTAITTGSIARFLR